MSQLFRDYSYTEEEVINTLTDAIRIVKQEDNTTAERLEDIKTILKDIWQIKNYNTAH